MKDIDMMYLLDFYPSEKQMIAYSLLRITSLLLIKLVRYGKLAMKKEFPFIIK